MTMTDAAAQSFLRLFFEDTAWLNIGDPPGLRGTELGFSFLFLTLHTSDPGEAGDQESGEAAYAGYARAQLFRVDSHWTIAARASTFSSLATFGKCTGGSSVLTHWGLGTAFTGPGNLISSTSLPSSITITPGIQPRVPISGMAFSIA